MPDRPGGIYTISRDYSLWADPDCASFLQLLGCRVLAPGEIRDLEVADLLKRVEKEWPSLSGQERVEHTRRIFRAWKQGLVGAGQLRFMTVKTRDGQWKHPEEVLFSEPFVPDHRIERLVAKGLLQVGRDELAFVSPEYLEHRGEDVVEWRRFFQELGVDRRLVDERLKDSIAERVAEAVLLRYERLHGRSPSRVPRAQERGYDFESGDRRIELKGRSRPEPPIDLTRAQYQALSDEDFYVYVVADALRNPVLYVLRGPKLARLLPEVSFSYREWGGLADARFAVLEGEEDSRDAASG